MGRMKTTNKSNRGAAGVKKSNVCKKKGQSASASHSKKDGFVRARGAPRRRRAPQQKKPRRKQPVLNGAIPRFLLRCLFNVVSLLSFTPEGWAASEQQRETNRAEYEAAMARGDEDYCANNWSFVVCSGTDYPIVAPHFYEQCFDTHNNGIDWDLKFPPVAGVWSNIKMRMTLGTSQPRAHLNFESVFAKLAQPFVQRRTGGECEVWQRPSHAAKMQKVREALLMAQAALAGWVGPQVQPFVGAIMIGANAVAAAMLPEFPAVSKKHLSLLSIDEEYADEQQEEEAEEDEEAVAAVESDDDEDSACDVNSVAASAIHDGDEDTNQNESAQEAPPEGQADEVREVQQSPAAVNVGAAEAAAVVATSAAEPSMLHSPQYSPLWSPIRSDAVDATGLGLTPLECATANGNLSGSLSPWSGVGSSAAALVAVDVDGAEHAIHDFAMPLLDADAAWHRWMRTE